MKVLENKVDVNGVVESPVASILRRLENRIEVPKSDKQIYSDYLDAYIEKKIKSCVESNDSCDNVDNSEKVEETKQEYLEDLKNNSEHPETIMDDGESYEKITPEENAEKRAEFNANKEKLIKEWEETNGKEWPRYKEDVVINGKIIRKAGDRYDAHHIHPLSMGGKNEAKNITPISAEKHFDKQGVHAPDSPYGKLEKTLQEGNSK
jgi:hypothetical protein